MVFFFGYEYFSPDLGMLQSVLMFLLVGQAIQLSMLLNQIILHVPGRIGSMIYATNYFHLALLATLEFLSDTNGWNTCN